MTDDSQPNQRGSKPYFDGVWTPTNIFCKLRKALEQLHMPYAQLDQPARQRYFQSAGPIRCARARICERCTCLESSYWDAIEHGQGTCETKAMVHLWLREDLTKWQRVAKGDAFERPRYETAECAGPQW